MKILIAYGSKRGGTQGLAEMLAEAFAAEGVDTDVRPARAVKHVTGYDAVVVGGALYASRWHKDARRFVKKHTATLRAMPVFVFSSGPLDDSAVTGDIPPVGQVHKLMDRVATSEHVTFGGRLTADAKGFPASAMAKDRAGDWRDPTEVTAWAHHVTDVVRHRTIAV